MESLKACEIKILANYLTLKGKDDFSESVVISDLNKFNEEDKVDKYIDTINRKEFINSVKKFLGKYNIPIEKVSDMKISILPGRIVTHIHLSEPITVNGKPVSIIVIQRSPSTNSKNAVIDDTTLRIFDKLDGC